jgi:hypothetical protein
VQNPFSGNKIRNLTFWIALVFIGEEIFGRKLQMNTKSSSSVSLVAMSWLGNLWTDFDQPCIAGPFRDLWKILEVSNHKLKTSIRANASICYAILGLHFLTCSWFFLVVRHSRDSFRMSSFVFVSFTFKANYSSEVRVVRCKKQRISRYYNQSSLF